MRPIIGVLLREDYTKENTKVNVLYHNIKEAFSNCTLIGILNFDKDVISFCDGIIGEGGDDIKEEDLKIIQYCYDHDIPYLGICLGMQEMGMLFDGKMNDFKNQYHKSKEKYVHDVDIKKDSFLYSIVKKEKIKVNSRHKSYIEDTSLEKVGYANTIIEAVEDRTKKFFLGLQWHPESMIFYDEDAKKIIDAFLVASKGEKYDN